MSENNTNIHYTWTIPVTEEQSKLEAINAEKINLIIQREIYTNLLNAVQTKLEDLKILDTYAPPK